MIFSATKTFSFLFYALFFIASVFLFSSCTTIKNYPANKPFVYDTHINLQGKFSTDEKKNLLTKLQQQLHDSIAVRKVQKLVLFQTLKNPPVYDSLNADKSVVFMEALLNSLGYYRDSITYDTTLQIVPATEGTQYRTTVNFIVAPGKLVHIDSVSFKLPDDTLMNITKASLEGTLLKRGEPFAKPLISSEFDRLTDIYRNHGYLKFSRDELLAVWDTVGLALLRPTLDPIEQAQQLEQLRRRRENPTADIEVRLRTNNDSSRLTRYYNGHVTIYPDLTVDTARYVSNTTRIGSIDVVAYRNLFKPKILAENVHLQTGELYSQRDYLKTLNRFNSLGAWRLVSIDPLPRPGSDTVDFAVKLTPAKKYLFNANLEGSQNWGNVFAEGNLLGIGVNIGFQNRNFAHAANQANTNFRFGTELSIANQNLVQTKQVTFGHTIYFPRIIPFVKSMPTNIKENVKTIFALNIGNTDRINYFNLTTFNTSWGYEFNWKNKLLGLRLPNIETGEAGYVFVNIADRKIGNHRGNQAGVKNVFIRMVCVE